MTRGENCYISNYEGTNSYEDVPKMAWTVLYVVKCLDPEDETVTCGSPYNFAMLNSPEIGHIGKNAHMSQLVKPILMKPMVLEQGHMRLPQGKVSNTYEQ